MLKNDIIRLQHMLDAAKEALSFTAGKTRSDLNENRMLVLSLIKEIEIIGESARKISDDTKNRLEDIPWTDIISMRNRLIHAYHDIDLDIVWTTTQEDLPSLIAVLENIIPHNGVL